MNLNSDASISGTHAENNVPILKDSATLGGSFDPARRLECAAI